MIKGPYAFLDTETTGLLFNRTCSHLVDLKLQPAIVEFCCIVYSESFTEMARLEFLCSLPKKCSVDDKAWAANGINPADLDGLPPFSENIDAINTCLSQASVIVGHNLAFDIGMLAVDYNRAGRDLDLSGKLQICTVEQTLPIKGHRLSLGAWHELLFGNKHESAHRASADVEALALCVQKSGMFR